MNGLGGVCHYGSSYCNKGSFKHGYEVSQAMWDRSALPGALPRFDVVGYGGRLLIVPTRSALYEQ
jgi:hypothetical protein